MCSSCNKLLDLQSFTKNQLKKKREPRCKQCVQTEVLGKIKGQNKSWEVLRVPAGAVTSWPQASFRPKTAVFSMQSQDNPLNIQNNDKKIRVLVAKGDNHVSSPTHAHQPQMHMHKRDPTMIEDWNHLRGAPGKQAITESPNNQPNSFEASRPVTFQAPHSTTAISVPVNISVDHSRSKIYQMSGDATNLAPSEVSANSSKPNPYAQTFQMPEAPNTDAGATASATMDPSMVKVQSPPSMPSIRPIISEAPPSSHQYATANAQIMPVPSAATNVNNEGVADTGDDADKKPTVQFLEWQDGSKYYGHVLNGERHGKGIFVWPDGTRYDGHWFENEMHGKGTLLLLAGTTWGSANWKWYNGNFQHGKYHGEGIFTWPDGAIYEGQWKQSRPHGYGSYESALGGKYIGDWRYGTQYGTGTCLYANGIMYTGEFKNNLRHGVGTCQWPNGSCYSGLWDNNEMRNPSNMKTCEQTVEQQMPPQQQPVMPEAPANGPSWDQVSQSMETAELLRAYLRRSFKKKK